MYKDINRPLLEGSYSNKPYYRDYRYLSDDKAVLKNPHKGWYWHYIDNGCTKKEYRDGIGDDTMLDFPCLNHLYLRIDWSDIEKSEGIFDWSYIDEIFEKWGKKGYRFSFRVCTYEGAPIKYATPAWVAQAGAKGWICEDGSWHPDYGDSIYLEKLENFMREYGKRFDGHPLVESVDVGTYGTWGEGHTEYGTDKEFSLETIIKHINLHLKYFHNTHLLVNDDMINALYSEDGSERKYLMDYCIGKGLGLRDDSIVFEGYARNSLYGYDTIRTPFMFDEFYESVPVDIEMCHFRNYSVQPDVFRDGYTVYEALKRSHATFAGFHGYPRQFLKAYTSLAERLANKLGYWYFLNGGIIPECVEGLPTVIDLWFENKGFCHAYNSYTIKIKLINESDKEEIIVSETIGKNLRWKSETVTKESFKLDLRAVKKGKYTLCIGMFEGDTSIKLGFKKPCIRTDGYYEFDTIDVKEQL